MAVKKCCVKKCKSCSDRSEDVGVTYHKFPKDPSVHALWVQATRHSHDLEPTTYVCSRHFLKCDFQKYQGSKYVLKSGAVPTIFPWLKNCKEKKNMDELDTFIQDNVDNEKNLSTSSKESEPENLESIKNFIEKHDKKEETAEKRMKGEEINSNLQADDEKTDKTELNNSKTELNESIDSSIPCCSKDETLAIASGVMNYIINETASKLEIDKNESPSHSSAQNATSGDKGFSSVALTVGSKVEAKDFVDNWYTVEIMEVDYDEMEVLVRYKSSTKKPEEWISVNSPRLRPATTKPDMVGKPKVTKPPPTVTEDVIPVKEEVITVKEEVTSMEAKPKAKFVVGERCLARWRDNRRFIATVHNDLGDGSYEIIFDDGFFWKCSASRLSKLKGSSDINSLPPTDGAGPSTAVPIPAPFHTHLFDPTRDYLGSKSERREQKRKLNIKEIFNIGQKQKKKETPIKDEKSKVSKTKKPRIINSKAKTTDSNVPKKNIPDAIASIIGTVQTKSSKKNKELQNEIKKQAKEDNKLKVNVDKSKQVTVKRASQNTLEEKGNLGEEETAVVNRHKVMDISFSDEETQSAKFSDGEFDSFDETDLASGDNDSILDPIMKEETRLQNFEKPDEEKHKEQVVRMKEAISKLQDKIDMELKAQSPKVELKERLIPIKVESEPEKKEEIKEVIQVDEVVDAEQKVDHTEKDEVKEKLTVDEEVNITEDVVVERVDVDGKVDIEDTVSIKDDLQEPESVPVKEDVKEELEVKQEQETKEVKEETEKPYQLHPIVKIKKMKTKSLKLRKWPKHEGKIVKKKKIVDTLHSKLEKMQMQLDAMQMQIKMKDEALQQLAQKKEILENVLQPNEWCCKWVNGEPVGTVVELEGSSEVVNTLALPRKTVQVQDKRLPEGWRKLMVRRSLGHSAGKWDVVLVSPENRRFHTKADMRHYLEVTNPSLAAYSNALLDFAAHLKEARRLGWVRGESRRRPAVSLKHRRKEKRRKLNDGRGKYVVDHDSSAPGTSDQSSLMDSSRVSFNNSTLEDGYVYVGSLKVQVIENLLRCPAEGCFKNFRNNTLLQMHIKHYHRELRKMLGTTPKVLDLAYARTAPTKTEAKRHDPDSKIIKVKIPRPPKRADDTKEVKENLEPQIPMTSPVSMLSPSQPERIPRSLDSPMMRQMQQLNKPVKRPRVLLPVRRPEPPVEPPPTEMPMDDMPDFEFDNSNPEPTIPVPLLEPLDFETAISTHTVTRPVDMKKADKRKVFATISKTPASEDEEVLSMNSDVETRSSFPRSGTPDSKTMEGKSVVDLQPIQPEPNEDPVTYMYTETGERIKLERMKREEIINCHCGFREEDGLMVQCELCLCWQHAHCYNIQREADVPKKYTCYICLNPRRGRRSQRFLQDQDRMTEGLLPGGRPSEALRRSHELSACLLHLLDALNALRLKQHVATKKNHPKLYLWASDWDSDSSDVQESPAGYSNMNPRDIGKENVPLQHDRMNMVPDMDRFSQGETSTAQHSLLGGLLSSPGGASLEMPISTSELEKFANAVAAEPERPAIVAPQPEAAIDNDVCLQRLVRHMNRCKLHLDARLDKLEADIVEMEAQDPMYMDDETADFFPRTKKTIQMLLRDLGTMELLGGLT